MTGNYGIPLTIEERKLLVEKALARKDDPDMLDREALELLSDDGLRVFARDFSEDEAFERALHSDFPEGLEETADER